jgi:transposase
MGSVGAAVAGSHAASGWALGRSPRGDQRVLRRARTGCPWRDLPSCYGNWKTVYNRHRRWSAEGPGARSWMSCAAAATRPPRVGPTRVGRWEPTRRWCARISTPLAPGVVRRRIWPPTQPWRSSATPRRPQGAASNDTDCAADNDREALGRSRGGLSTKIHLAADDRCRPIARVITPGQRHDAVAFQPLMTTIRIRRHGRGRPRTRPGIVRGQGLLQPRYPRLPAPTPHSRDHSPAV